ncbi:MAG: hypothetical protein MR503_06495 [Oscillospiraceae bacterium]|nr:hypothetical protein [Oscillospiraceae bacterium]
MSFKQLIAGIAGKAKVLIQNCYNMSTVTATYRKAYIAGVCGEYIGSGKVENCYNMGKIDSTSANA